MPKSYSATPEFGSGAPSADSMGFSDDFYISQDDVLVTGAGEDGVDGTYVYTTTLNGKPLYNLEGHEDGSTDFAIWNNTVLWLLYYASGQDYIGTAESAPWDATWGAFTVTVAGAGTSAINGTYTAAIDALHNGRPFYTLAGANPLVSAISWSGTAWQIFDSGGDVFYDNGDENVSLPQLSAFWEAINGDNPAPTVTDSSIAPTVAQLPTVKTVTREIGNVGYMARPIVPIVTAAGTTTLYATDVASITQFTGSTTQNVLLPVVSTFLTTGNEITIYNDSSGIVTVKSSGGDTVLAMAPGSRANFVNLAITGTEASRWDFEYDVSGGGVTNSAPANTIPKSDGTNLVSSNITDDGTTTTVGGQSAYVQGGVDARVSVSGPTSFYSSATQVIMGDYQDDENGTKIIVDDRVQTITLSRDPIFTSGQLNPLYGGTGINTSASTGVPVISFGTWSVNSQSGLPLASYLTSDYTNATSTFSSTNLSLNVVAGVKYTLELRIFASNSVAADGFKIDFNGGSATMTEFVAGSATSLVTGTTSSLSGTFSNGTLTGTNMVTISGSFKPSANGTFIVRGAENAHTTGTLTFGKGSSLVLIQCP